MPFIAEPPPQKLWRWLSKLLENLYSTAVIRAHYDELIEAMMSPNEENLAHIRKWFSLSEKYLQYYARGGTELLSEADMRAFDLSSLGLLPSATLPRDVDSLFALAHELNWRVIRGKHLAQDAEPWSAQLPQGHS